MRKYALRKWTDGDWLCPSNDGRSVWRFRRYEEDGSLTAGNTGEPIVGTYWEVYCVPIEEFDRWRDRAANDPYLNETSIEDVSWLAVASLRKTRKDAIAVMEEHGE